MAESDDERKTFYGSNASGEEEEDPSYGGIPTKEGVKRGRPVGKVDANQRYRRTAQEISDDKISVAQMKLDAMKEKEALKLTLRTSRKFTSLRKPAPVSTPRISSPKSKENKPPTFENKRVAHTYRRRDNSATNNIGR